jgi:hypothetical protein
MKTQIKVFLAVLSTFVLLMSAALAAFAGGPTWHPLEGSGVLLDEVSAIPKDAKCTKMQVSDPVLWFATDKKGNVYPDKVTKQYPTGTTTIASGFEYNCIPQSTTLTVVYYFGGTDTEPVFTDSTKEPASNDSGTYYWYIGTKDGSALPEGSWQAEWYADKKLLTSGEITVGGGTKKDIQDIQKEATPTEEAMPTEEAEPTEEMVEPTAEPTETTGIEDIWDFGDEKQKPAETVTVQGTVLDGKTKKPIGGALFIVLNPGITTQEWVDKDFPMEDVFTGGQTDKKGRFVCDQKLERNVTYSVVVAAKGYQPIVVDDFTIDSQQEDPVDLTIKMYK